MKYAVQRLASKGVLFALAMSTIVLSACGAGLANCYEVHTKIQVDLDCGSETIVEGEQRAVGVSVTKDQRNPAVQCDIWAEGSVSPNSFYGGDNAFSASGGTLWTAPAYDPANPQHQATLSVRCTGGSMDEARMTCARTLLPAAVADSAVDRWQGTDAEDAATDGVLSDAACALPGPSLFDLATRPVACGAAWSESNLSLALGGPSCTGTCSASMGYSGSLFFSGTLTINLTGGCPVHQVVVNFPQNYGSPGSTAVRLYDNLGQQATNVAVPYDGGMITANSIRSVVRVEIHACSASVLGVEFF